MMFTQFYVISEGKPIKASGKNAIMKLYEDDNIELQMDQSEYYGKKYSFCGYSIHKGQDVKRSCVYRKYKDIK